MAAWGCSGGLTAAELARPTPQQYAWQEQERIMFIHFAPNTWQGAEYDNLSTPLDQINPAELDAEQFCRAAQAWGAKEIIFVAKHAGGFCWWPTETTDYCVRKTPWRGGKGDLLREVADACRKNGLKLGVYISPCDKKWEAGGGGRTRDPARQAAYNTVYRKQWTEVLSGYGPITEVWFDGSCTVEVGDILKKYAPDAVVFQGPYASIRWPGSESGRLPYPVWSALKSADLRTGGATARNDDPDGDAWAPHEADTPLYEHFWFWSPEKEKKRKSLDELMDIYVKSVGRGGVLLLNSTPDTHGRLPDGDMHLYAAFGREIDRCYGHSVAETNGSGKTVELAFTRPAAIDGMVLMEDYREGHRIREYVLEGWNGNNWKTLAAGTSVGRMKIDSFQPVQVDKVRVRVTRSVGEPLIRRLAVYLNGRAPVLSLSRGKPTRASSFHSAPFAPDKATDGEMQTRWAAKGGDPHAWLEVDLGAPARFGKVTVRENARRIREFNVEYRNDEAAPWQVALRGKEIGPNYAGEFSSVTGRYVRLRVGQVVKGEPTIYEFEVWPGSRDWQPCGAWEPGMTALTLNLNRFITKPGQYEVHFQPSGGNIRVVRASLWLDGEEALPGMLVKTGDFAFNINRTAQVTGETSSVLKVELEGADGAGTVRIRPATP